MSWYSLKAYIRYKRKAKTRHGVHSPFVFDFIENVLHNKANIAATDIQGRIAVYYKVQPIFIDLSTATIQAVDNILSPTHNDSVIIVSHLHDSGQTEQAWQKLTAKPKVTMSIDIFTHGLLLFRTDFKVKQYFILK